MITTTLRGGAGNQLFQLGFGMAQAKRFSTFFQVDPSRLGGSRSYCLNQWLVPTPQTFIRMQTTVKENGMPYNQALVNSIKDGDVLEGFWQSEKYIESVSKELRTMNQFVSMSDRSKVLAKEIKACNAVAVHVRRGDYLVEPHKSFHGVLEGAYYVNAVGEINLRVGNPKFYLFSDDENWCLRNFRINNMYVVAPGGEAEHIYLMSLCKHAIIANSTFSWWGAWMGDDKPGRTVIAPKRWFDQAPEDPRDIVPERWIKI